MKTEKKKTLTLFLRAMKKPSKRETKLEKRENMLRVLFRENFL